MALGPKALKDPTVEMLKQADYLENVIDSWMKDKTATNGLRYDLPSNTQYNARVLDEVCRRYRAAGWSNVTHQSWYDQRDSEGGSYLVFSL